MNAKILGGLVARVIKTRTKEILSDDDKKRFHREIQSDIGNDVEKLRAEKRRAYEELKNIAVQ